MRFSHSKNLPAGFPSHRPYFLGGSLVCLFLLAQTGWGQIGSIQRMTYDSPLIDSLPGNWFPRGGTYTAIIYGTGLAQVTGFVASDPNVTGVVSSAMDSAVTVQISSNPVCSISVCPDNAIQIAPIPGVSFTLLTEIDCEPVSLSSGAVTLDIVVSPPPQLTNFKVVNSVKWIPGGGVPTPVTFSVNILTAGNGSFNYVGCGNCSPQGEAPWGPITGTQFAQVWTFTWIANVPADFGLTSWGMEVGVVDGAGQGGVPANVPQSPVSLTVPVVQMQLVDPVPALLDGPTVTGDPTRLSTQGTIVNGVAADGVTQAVIRIAGAPPNETFSLTLAQDGGLAEIESPNFQSSIPALQADSSGNALVLYRAPDDFAQSGTIASIGAASRTVDLNYQSTDNPGVIGDTQINIVRPPVLLIHGIWGAPSNWTNFIANLNGLAGGQTLPFELFPIAYNFPLPVITGIQPPLPASALPAVQAANTVSSLGFNLNEGIVLPQIYQYIANFKQANNVAAVSADVVAHSMGGLITRSLPRLQGAYYSDGTFGEGPVHKLITIDTPHLGTPLAIDLLSTGGTVGDNSCVRQLFATQGMLPASSVSLANFGPTNVSGAAGDLEGDGVGGSLSAALSAIRVGTPSIPTAFIAGNGCGIMICGMTLTGSLDVSLNRIALEGWCGTVKGNPLGKALDPADWPHLFNQDSDAIVPMASQTNLSSSAMVFPTVHSQGTQLLGFTASDALGDVGVASAVIKLLDTPRTTTPTYTWLY